MVINLELKAPNNNLHADCHKRHGFCKEKELQKPRHLWQQVKLALCKSQCSEYENKLF